MDPNGGDPKALRRADFPVLRELPTRWSDDDVYGHLNNVVHYAMFDSAVNGWLMDATGTDIRRLPAIGLVVETQCRYFAELRFPDVVTAGLGLERVGNSSVVYRLALFGPAREATAREATGREATGGDTAGGETAGGDAPAAVGRFVHVYVDRESRRPVPVPDRIRAALRLLESTVEEA